MKVVCELYLLRNICNDSTCFDAREMTSNDANRLSMAIHGGRENGENA